MRQRGSTTEHYLPKDVVYDHILSKTEILAPMAGAAIVDLESRSSNILFTKDVLFLPRYYTYGALIIIVIISYSFPLFVYNDILIRFSFFHMITFT